MSNNTNDVFVKVYHAPEEYVNENKCVELFIKVNMVEINDMIHEAYVMPMASGSLLRFVDSIIDENRNKQIVSVNYMKCADIHLVQTDEDEKFHLVTDKPTNKLSELAKKEDSGVRFDNALFGVITPVKVKITQDQESVESTTEEVEEENDNFSINEEEESKEEDSSVVMLSNRSNQIDTKMSSPALETPNRVHLDNRKEPQQYQQRQPIQQQQQNPQYDSRMNLRQRLQNPNSQNRPTNNSYRDSRNNQPQRQQSQPQYQQNQQQRKNDKNRKPNNFRPVLAPTNLEMVRN